MMKACLQLNSDSFNENCIDRPKYEPITLKQQGPVKSAGMNLNEGNMLKLKQMV